MIIDDLIYEDDEEIEIEEKEIKTNLWMKDGAGSYCAGAGNHKLQRTCQYYEKATHFERCLWCRQDWDTCRNQKAWRW